MTKDDIIGRIITLVHAEVQNIYPTLDTVAEGRANASARTAIVDRLVTDISKESANGLVDLMEVLNDRRPDAVYPEVRLLQQWQNMSILDTPMDNYYAADLLFSKQRAGMTLAGAEIKELSSIANINFPHPWPAGFNAPVLAQAVPVAAPVVAAAPLPPAPWLSAGQPAASTAIVGDIHGDVAPELKAVVDSLSAVPEQKSFFVGDTDSVEDATPAAADVQSTAPATISVLVDAEEDAPAAADAVEERVRSNPVASYQEKRGMIEDVALANGLPIFSGKEWRATKMLRTQPILVADFDFATIAKEGVGRAAYLLVGPSAADDIRIEIKSQSTSGSAGDKLPTSLLRMVNAAKSNSYGSALVGVVGLQYFAPEALTLAREVASRSSRVRLVEGSENFIDAVQQSITAVKFTHAAALSIPATVGVSTGRTPSAAPAPNAAPASPMDDAAYGGPSLYAGS